MKPAHGLYLDVSIAAQQLAVIENNQVQQIFPISTAKNGPGQLCGSECTPLGWLQVRAKIGVNAPLNSVFIGRRPTGEIYNPALAAQYPQRDWILTRILWLGGLEPGFNRYGKVDTTWRYIYIHGSPTEGVLAGPASHGCIRMLSEDIISLFERVAVGCRLFIHAD